MLEFVDLFGRRIVEDTMIGIGLLRALHVTGPRAETIDQLTIGCFQEQLVEEKSSRTLRTSMNVSKDRTLIAWPCLIAVLPSASGGIVKVHTPHTSLVNGYCLSCQLSAIVEGTKIGLDERVTGGDYELKSPRMYSARAAGAHSLILISLVRQST